MQFSIFLVTLGVAVIAQAAQGVQKAKGLRFVGVGYNILKGNPEGGELSRGGVDPGLLPTRKIFQLTWDTNATTVDGMYERPDQVQFIHRSSCVKNTEKEMFSGTKSYQNKLKADVEASAGYDSGLWSAAFSLSARYEKVDEETSQHNKVFFEKIKICNNGTARYLVDKAKRERFPVTEDFAAAVCSLPETFKRRPYFRFIESWGTTDIVEKVELGTKETERYESSYIQIAKDNMENIGATAKVEGGYMGFSASLSASFDKFKKSKTDNTTFSENKVEFSSGGPDMPEPIRLGLMPIYNAINTLFFRKLDRRYQCGELAKRRNNVKTILKKYPRIKNVKKPEDPETRIPITWPLGTYGLPMPKSGCPHQTFWHEGTRLHDTENSGVPRNAWSDPYDLAGIIAKNDMEQKFCMKTKDRTSEYNLPWPTGQYCIFKKGNCPEGLETGSIKWDDEDDNNHDSLTGSLPDGEYTHDTKIYFCCRTDGHATNAIVLPTDSPFVLFKSNTHQCQYVKEMKVTSEYFYWDNEDDQHPNTDIRGQAPYAKEEGLNDADIRLDYCYYVKAED